MMPDLRARIRAAAERAEKDVPTVHECLVLERRTPLSELPGLLAAGPELIRPLGLDFPGFDVRRALFLDTETTGLHGAGTVAFLVGLGSIEGDAFVVRQLLMRDYPEEEHLLSLLAEALQGFDTVISFNGKSFDMPLLASRFTMARLRPRWRDLHQLDLLHAARRTWKLRLNRCTLSRLETEELGIRREGDLPSAEVPERFFAYLKTGDFSLLEDVLAHNLQDIVTLAALLSRLAAIYAAPEAQTSFLDVFSVGRAFDRFGDGELARRCYRVASVSALSGQARLQIALSFRRERDYRGAAEAYQGLIACGEADAAAYAALAILLERYLADAPGALEITEKAILRFSGSHLGKGADHQEALEALHRRRKRLCIKINRDAK